MEDEDKSRMWMDEVRGNNDSDIVDVMTRSHLIKFNYTYLILVSAILVGKEAHCWNYGETPL